MLLLEVVMSTVVHHDPALAFDQFLEYNAVLTPRGCLGESEAHVDDGACQFLGAGEVEIDCHEKRLCLGMKCVQRSA